MPPHLEPHCPYFLHEHFPASDAAFHREFEVAIDVLESATWKISWESTVLHRVSQHTSPGCLVASPTVVPLRAGRPRADDHATGLRKTRVLHSHDDKVAVDGPHKHRRR